MVPLWRSEDSNRVSSLPSAVCVLRIKLGSSGFAAGIFSHHLGGATDFALKEQLSKVWVLPH